MKPFFWLAGGLVLLFAWLALRGIPGEVLVAPAGTAGPPAPAALRTAAPASPAAPQGVRVHGVMYRGAESPKSQALISVQGAAAGAFAVGEHVAQGWSLHAVGRDHVVLAQGNEKARLDVAQPVQAESRVNTPAAQVTTVNLPAQPAAKEEMLPGFIPHSAGASPPPRRPDPAANRRFLEERQKRLAVSR